MSTNLGSSHQRDLAMAMRFGYWTGALIVVVIEAGTIGLFVFFMHAGMVPWPCR